MCVCRENKRKVEGNRERKEGEKNETEEREVSEIN